MLIKHIRKIALGLGIISLANMGVPVMAKGSKFVGEYAQGEILSLGSSLNDKQEEYLRNYFGAPKDIDAIYVDTAMAVKQLGLDESMLTTYKGGWYSSAYVKLTNGTGIKVTADNLTLVTDDMLANALITSGILNADVIASAPFKVTGESALAGILAGAEEIMGEKLSQENKETAQKEIETTLDVAEEIGQKEASTIMNEIKAEVIKDSPINITQIENIVINVTNNYGIELSDKARAKVVDTMSDINNLDIDYKEVKDTLKDVGNKLFQDLKDALDKGEEIGMKIKESGVFEKVWNWIKNVWNSFWDLFKSNNDDVDKAEFENNENTENDGLKEESEKDESANENNGPSLGETEIEEENIGEESDNSMDEDLDDNQEKAEEENVNKDNELESETVEDLENKNEEDKEVTE